MSDSTILYAGMACFSLIIFAFGLTVREFRKMTKTAAASKLEP